MEGPANGSEPLEMALGVQEEKESDNRRIDYVPEYRLSYPLWITFMLGVVLLAVALYAMHFFSLPPAGAAVLIAFAIGAAALWRHDSNNTLRGRVPPAGWKSVIKPDKLVNMEPADFDELMRFELKGDEDDNLEDHRVRWASRYSRDVIFISKCLVVLALASPIGAVLFPSVTISLSDTELPQTQNLVLAWLVATPVLLAVAWMIRFDWHYRRLMLDETQLYLLKENPAWLPWNPGQNDPIPLASIWSADPVDTEWGKRWGHGTVILSYQLGVGHMRTKRLRRVPSHRTFCDAINSMRGQGGIPHGGMGMMY